MMGVLQLVKDQVKFLIDLENAMTRIKIVGKGTAEEFANLKDSLIALSIAYGTSATDALEAAKIFSQQGKTVSETLKLTQVAMIGAQVLGENVKTTVDNMTAAMNAFNISADESTTIVDKWINVEKNFVVTSKDLAEATKVAGATANQMGVSISEFLGDVTAIIEVTRKSGSEAARGLSFVYARLYTTAQKTISQISKIKFYLDAQKKATNELTGVLRPASDILGELATKWETLTKEEKLQIATSLGSKRQMVTVNALLQNYNRSIDARIKALTSAGEAEKAFNLIQDTTAFKLKQTTSSWNSLTNAIGDTSGSKPF
jgi:TP901 family phage tail tape measure protein